MRYLTQLIYWPVHNRVVAPLMDRAFWAAVRQNAQGADHPGYAFDAVSPTPLSREDAQSVEPLPLSEAVRAELLARADEAASSLLPELRKQVTQAAFGAQVAVISESSEFVDALVHTGYFRNSRILRCIATHVLVRQALLHQESAQLTLPSSPVDVDWYRQARAAVALQLKELGITDPCDEIRGPADH